MVNYIGIKDNGADYNVKPVITSIKLPEGKYTFYYIGGNKNDIEITFVNDADNNVTVSPIKQYAFATNKLIMHEAEITVNKEYNGEITLYNSTTWLPDLYSVKLVPQTEAPPTETPTYTWKAEYNKNDGQAEITAAEDCGATVIFAAYNSEGILESLSVRENIKLKKGNQNIKPDEKFNDDVFRIEVFVWDSLDSMKPKI